MLVVTLAVGGSAQAAEQPQDVEDASWDFAQSLCGVFPNCVGAQSGPCITQRDPNIRVCPIGLYFSQEAECVSGACTGCIFRTFWKYRHRPKYRGIELSYCQEAYLIAGTRSTGIR